MSGVIWGKNDNVAPEINYFNIFDDWMRKMNKHESYFIILKRIFLSVISTDGPKMYKKWNWKFFRIRTFSANDMLYIKIKSHNFDSQADSVRFFTFLITEKEFWNKITSHKFFHQYYKFSQCQFDNIMKLIFEKFFSASAFALDKFFHQ